MNSKKDNATRLIRSIVHMFLNGKADRTITDPKTILIIQPAKLGDMVCTTPMFRAVKKRYPNSRLIVAGNKINGELLMHNTDVDQYVELLSEVEMNANQFRSCAPDFACITAPSFDLLAALCLAGIKSVAVPRIVGWSPYETKAYKVLRQFAIQIPHTMGNYAPREYLKLLEPIGVHETDTGKHLGFSEEARNSAQAFFKDVAFPVGVSITAGNKIKEWGIEKWQGLISKMIENTDAAIFLLGAEADRVQIEGVIAKLAQDRIKPLIGLSLDDLKAHVAGLRMFVSVDTGPIYIAEAFGVPTVDITGPIDEKEQPPMGPLHKVVIPPDRKQPELFVMNARVYDKTEARRQVDSITVEQVLTTVQELIKEIRNE